MLSLGMGERFRLTFGLRRSAKLHHISIRVVHPCITYLKIEAFKGRSMGPSNRRQWKIHRT
ncbi:Protein of unknown function [Pyronema omphalodes CBS 100304]|uniref:Uncharacterized protein n=1 Tax=Pyronema omphalodes (strain CBS 100304) TaxID=1076935 RepID=U4KW93_PYROM|nr:Protein of unknown function [Pyronema omphalodes CBS 100304]